MERAGVGESEGVRAKLQRQRDHLCFDSPYCKRDVLWRVSGEQSMNGDQYQSFFYRTSHACPPTGVHALSFARVESLNTISTNVDVFESVPGTFPALGRVAKQERGNHAAAGAERFA